MPHIHHLPMDIDVNKKRSRPSSPEPSINFQAMGSSPMPAREIKRANLGLSEANVKKFNREVQESIETLNNAAVGCHAIVGLCAEFGPIPCHILLRTVFMECLQPFVIGLLDTKQYVDLIKKVLEFLVEPAAEKVRKWLVDEDIRNTVSPTMPQLDKILEIELPIKKQSIKSALADVTKVISKLIESGKAGEILPWWKPTSQHLRELDLKIPANTQGQPQLLFHELGEFDDSSFEGLTINKYTMFHNTTGSGKTRLVFETLCNHFGLYINCKGADLEGFGTDDYQFCLKQLKSELKCQDLDLIQVNEKIPMASANTATAEGHFAALILARMLIFRAFLAGLPKPYSMLHRRLWLLAQTHPSLVLGSDLFQSIRMTLHPHIGSQWLRFINEFSTVLPELSLCVLDEAQTAVATLPNAFLNSIEKDLRPLLRPLLTALQTIGKSKLIVTGTGFSKTTMEDAVKSHNLKQEKWNIFTDTGSFDNRTDHTKYIIQYLWPGLCLNDLPLGAHFFLDRCWRWLRGRHRFTAAFIQSLLSSKKFEAVQGKIDYLEQYHGHLTNFVFHATGGFKTTEHVSWENTNLASPPKSIKTLRAFDFKKLLKTGDTLLLQHVFHLVACYLFDTNNNTAYVVGEAEDDARNRDQEVELGFARCSDYNSKPVINEPLVILAARRAFEQDHAFQFLSEAAKVVQFSESRSAMGMEWDRLLAYYFSRRFDQPVEISDVFQFPNELLSNHFQNKKMRLVTVQNTLVYKSGWNAASNVPLFTKAKSSDDTTAWFQDSCGVPLLLPDDHMGPDIIALFEIDDGSRIWICIQNKLRASKVSLKDMKDAASSLIQSHWWTMLSDGARKPYSRDSGKQRDEVKQLMQKVPHLQLIPNPPIPAAAIHDTRTVEAPMDENGQLYLHVLSFVAKNEESIEEQLSKLQAQHRSPLALLKLDDVQEMFGRTLMTQLRR